jgi:NAD(P)-dependent dehydrogenase (short-subunit alcohol dehydrogenase family)
MQSKVLIITGSAGIGAETVRMAAPEGARIVIATSD